MADSSVICQYLDAVYPEKSLTPMDPWAAARAAFYEEYVDGAAIPRIGPKTLFERFVKPKFMGQPTDESVVAEAVANELPPFLEWLDAELGGKGWLVDDRITLADVSLGCFLTLLRTAGVEYDHSRYVHLSRYGNSLLARPSFTKFAEIAKTQLPE